MYSKAPLIKHFNFGAEIIPPSLIFIYRKNTIAFIPNQQIAEGHVIICSKRQVTRLADLNEIETLDLWMTACEVAKSLEANIYNKGCQIFFQDGVYDDKIVNHVNIQILPIDKKIGTKKTLGKIESLEEIANKYRSFFEQSFN